MSSVYFGATGGGANSSYILSPYLTATAATPEAEPASLSPTAIGAAVPDLPADVVAAPPSSVTSTDTKESIAPVGGSSMAAASAIGALPGGEADIPVKSASAMTPNGGAYVESSQKPNYAYQGSVYLGDQELNKMYSAYSRRPTEYHYAPRVNAETPINNVTQDDNKENVNTALVQESDSKVEDANNGAQAELSVEESPAIDVVGNLSGAPMQTSSASTAVGAASLGVGLSHTAKPFNSYPSQGSVYLGDQELNNTYAAYARRPVEYHYTRRVNAETPTNNNMMTKDANDNAETVDPFLIVAYAHGSNVSVEKTNTDAQSTSGLCQANSEYHMQSLRMTTAWSAEDSQADTVAI